MNKLSPSTTKTLHIILLAVTFVMIGIALVQMFQGQQVNMTFAWIVTILIFIDILVVKVFGSKSS